MDWLVSAYRQNEEFDRALVKTWRVPHLYGQGATSRKKEIENGLLNTKLKVQIRTAKGRKELTINLKRLTADARFLLTCKIHACFSKARDIKRPAVRRYFTRRNFIACQLGTNGRLA